MRLTNKYHTGSVSATEDIIEKHLKVIWLCFYNLVQLWLQVMDKIDKKKNDVKAIIAKGEKLESMPKAPVTLENDFKSENY